MSKSDPVSLFQKQAPSPHQIQLISSWFQKLHPFPGQQDIHALFSDHVSAAQVLLAALREAAPSHTAREELGLAINVLDFTQRRLRSCSGGVKIEIDDLDRLMVLSALCEQVASAIGIAQLLEMDIAGALREITDANHSKLDDTGQPVFNEAGHLVPGVGAFDPDLSKFLGG